MQTLIIVLMIYIFHLIIEKKIHVHYKNLENEGKQTKINQKPPQCHHPARIFCTCLQLDVFWGSFLWSGHV